MIAEQISLNLPPPWAGATFEADEVGPINYLVGPNGSGKSRFASELLQHLNNRSSKARLLSTDRLKEMTNPGRLGGYYGDPFQSGIARNQFDQLRAAASEGSGIDAVLLLEERMDLRIRIEATLSQLFGRDVVLEWDSGNLVPKAVRRQSGESYRLDRDECHGIKELVVLLTHLYDHGNDYLIIDEPELNLHPQYQAFFMQEVRKVAGSPAESAKQKIVFLITHSPFILDLRFEQDIKSVISFDLDYSVPKQVARVAPELPWEEFAAGRVNSHGKQLFFSDNPIFVEGPLDAAMIEALMEARGISAAAAGSCIIDCGGAEVVNDYLMLCQALGKEAHFVYDLDCVFVGRLRSRVKDDDSVQDLLAAAGVGLDFSKYVGKLCQCLNALINRLPDESLNGDLERLRRLFNTLGENREEWDKQKRAKAWITTMTAISLHRDEIASKVPARTVEDIEGRWQKILDILAEKNIHVLPGGTIERYLPCFCGDRLQPTQEAKRNAVNGELKALQRIRHLDDANRESKLRERYGKLYDVVRKLPSKEEVDYDDVLRAHLSDYVHELQLAVMRNPVWDRERIDRHMSSHGLTKSGVVSLGTFQPVGTGRFHATVDISEILGKKPRVLEFDSDTTIANMGEFRETEPNGAMT